MWFRLSRNRLFSIGVGISTGETCVITATTKPVVCLDAEKQWAVITHPVPLVGPGRIELAVTLDFVMWTPSGRYIDDCS